MINIGGKLIQDVLCLKMPNFNFLYLDHLISIKYFSESTMVPIRINLQYTLTFGTKLREQSAMKCHIYFEAIRLFC